MKGSYSRFLHYHNLRWTRRIPRVPISWYRRIRIDCIEARNLRVGRNIL